MSKLALLGSVVLLAFGVWQVWPTALPSWTAEEIEILKSLSLESLPALPADPSNAVADNSDAAEFGRQMFFDQRLSANGAISCATCHQAERRFTDGLQKAQALGTTDRHTPSIVGSAYSPWQFWDGRRDSQWSQALAPLEDANEHGLDRDQVVELVLSDPLYRSTYERLFPYDEFDVTVAFANIGKSIAAFERTVMPTASRFDEYVQAAVNNSTAAQTALMSEDEVRGLRLFIGDANCTQCHNGPLLTNHEFHNTGVINFPGDVPDLARAAGVREVLSNEFNCLGVYSDDPEKDCVELQFVRSGDELIGAFKTPSLRNLQDTAPFMHKGQLATLADVLRHYNEAPDAMVGHNEAKPLQLNDRELRQIEAFLHTLSAPATTAHMGGAASSLQIDTTPSL